MQWYQMPWRIFVLLSVLKTPSFSPLFSEKSLGSHELAHRNSTGFCHSYPEEESWDNQLVNVSEKKWHFSAENELFLPSAMNCFVAALVIVGIFFFKVFFIFDNLIYVYNEL